MAKNHYAKVLKDKLEQEYCNGIWDGLQMGLNIVAIALNHKFSFGDKRLTELESYVQDLVNEIVEINDPELTKKRIEKAIQQIRKEKVDE